MKPTEHEMTVMADTAARFIYDEATEEGTFDKLPKNEQMNVKQHVLGHVIAAIEALPDRVPTALRHAAVDTRARTAANGLAYPEEGERWTKWLEARADTLDVLQSWHASDSGRGGHVSLRGSVGDVEHDATDSPRRDPRGEASRASNESSTRRALEEKQGSDPESIGSIDR